ncbi:MAG TPA: prephenate dehydrogenase/arogenate dehydrogenase family protein [Burkholderiales bacterium]|jgi:prephenate dehydrogenase|nr:prephenate dehydrogenase/arogenate dehydrogenase family protein [Burkholderiales bacterium]
MLFQRAAIVGVGLIGGSFALALKQAKACTHIVGCGRSAANLKLAAERGIVDSIASDPGAAVRGADLVLVAAPVAQFPGIFSRMKDHLEKSAVITDGGSTKRDVIAAARAALGARMAQFVPAHPVAGAEKSGAAAASAELFRGKRVVLTPVKENSEATIERAEKAWAACGARVTRMDAEEHDAVLAVVSHLPHLLAYALVHEVASRENSEALFSFAAGGFRDFTRIASSHPEMWRDICMANRDRLRAELARFSKKLDQVNRLLDEPEALEKLFAEARAARDKWIRSN